jgi:hypothetical protein
LIDADRDLVFSDDPTSVWRDARARVRVDLQGRVLGYIGQTHRIMGTATATIMISSGRPTRQ